MSMTISGNINSYHGNSPITVEDTQCLTKYYEKNEEYRDVESEYEGRESLNKKIHVYTGDITDFSVDAIVCSVQTLLTCKPYGMHSTVMRRAGEVYEKTVKEVGYCKAGQAFITDGHDLHAKYVIHTAGPSPDTILPYNDRKSCLKKSYLSCLDIVGKSQGIRSVAIPCLGCGGGGLELIDAISTAVTTIRQWLETDNNLTQVDSIILVMYNVCQCNEYMQELIKIFPYGKDLAGIDLEALNYADERTMSSFVPQELHSTNILCYKFNKHSVKLVSKHFHSLVNQLHIALGTRSKPPERFKNCGRIFIKSAKKFVVVYHGNDSCTLEVQIFSSSLDNSDLNICRNVQSVVDTYLSANLENVTEFKPYIRCENSSWNDKDGLISTYKIQRKMSRNSSKMIQCRHRKSSNNIQHSVDIQKISKFWIHRDQGSLPREPSEHNERADESEGYISSQAMPSIPSLERSSGSKKKQGIIMATRHFPCKPVEHFDDSQSLLSIGQTPVSSQDLSCIACDNKVNNQLSSFQPLDDSLLTTRHEQCSCGGESNTNIFSRHNSSSSMQAWQPESEEHPGCQTQGKVAVGNKHYRSSGECENNVHYTSTRQVKNKQKVFRGKQDGISCSAKQRSSEYSKDDKYNCGSGQVRHDSRSSSSFGDLNSDSLAGACGGGSHGYTSEINLRCSNEMSSLNDQALIQVARLIGNKDSQLGLELGLPYALILRIKNSNTDDAVLQAYHILREWKIRQRGKPRLQTLKDAMVQCSIDISTLNL